MIGSLGALNAVLWPALGVVLRTLFTRRFPGPAGVLGWLLLTTLFTQYYFTPMWTEYMHLRIEDKKTTFDHKRFCFRYTPVSVAFIKTCMDTEVQLGTWPLFRAHDRVVEQLGAHVYGLLTHPVAISLLVLAATSSALWLQRKVAPAIDGVRLAKLHADRQAQLAHLGAPKTPL
jgi:hypothetical protein